VKDLIPVRPVLHYMMGGVSTDINGATPLPGLYAAGEVACVSINGANRLGSNSLSELLVFGARAGKVAAEHASRGGEISQSVLAQTKDEHRRIEQELFARKGSERIAQLREEMQKTMEESAGIYRTGAALTKSIDVLHRLQERYTNVMIEDHSKTFNTERVYALELQNMLDVAETIVLSALRREESRGAHQRTDFPKRDDQRFLGHSLVYRNPDGSARVEYLPVTITRWPPAERIYGENAPHAGSNKAPGSPLPS
jgi:fumarate reductase flavoprotein subunit